LASKDGYGIVLSYCNVSGLVPAIKRLKALPSSRFRSRGGLFMLHSRLAVSCLIIFSLLVVSGGTVVGQVAAPSKSADDKSFEYTPANLEPVFDKFWAALDNGYSYFVLKAKVDWAKLKEEHRSKALAAKNEAEFVGVLKKMLEPLNDIHVFIITKDGQRVDTGKRTWDYNGNRKVVLDQLESKVECGSYATVAKTKPDGFGYFLMQNQGSATKTTVEKAAKAIRDLNDAPGFIVDLRRANGGSEPLAQEIAKLFCDMTVVYAKSKYRSGPGHDEFGRIYERKLEAGKPGAAFTKPVACLLGPGCISSGEGFAKMMKALPHVTTVGLPTAGASGNPRPVKLGETGITVYYSSWVDMLPDGTGIEGKGVPPEIEVRETANAYKDADPTLAKALEILRDKIKK
jgi:hypothetical protein